MTTAIFVVLMGISLLQIWHTFGLNKNHKVFMVSVFTVVWGYCMHQPSGSAEQVRSLLFIIIVSILSVLVIGAYYAYKKHLFYNLLKFVIIQIFMWVTVFYALPEPMELSYTIQDLVALIVLALVAVMTITNSLRIQAHKLTILKPGLIWFFVRRRVLQQLSLVALALVSSFLPVALAVVLVAACLAIYVGIISIEYLYNILAIMGIDDKPKEDLRGFWRLFVITDVFLTLGLVGYVIARLYPFT